MPTQVAFDQRGQEVELPWPILTPAQCFCLDHYPVRVIDDDGQPYTIQVCPLCGHVQSVQVARHTRGPRGAVLMAKAADAGFVDWKNDPRYRWITLHPHGKDEEGYPVLIRMDDPAGESGSGHIVAGAGGALNYRRVTGVRSREHYRTEARKRRLEQELHQRAKEQKRWKEALAAGMSERELAAAEEKRQEALVEIELARRKAEADYLGKIGAILGWEPIALDDETKAHMPADSVVRIERERRRRLLQAAEKLDRAIKDIVIQDHDERMARELGDVARPQELVSDEVDDSGLGYVAAIERLAAENGLPEYHAREESRAATDVYLEAAEEEGYIKSAARARVMIDMLQDAAAQARMVDAPFRELGLHKPETPQEDLTPEKARQILIARERWRQQEAELRAKESEIDDAAPTDLTKIPRGDALVEVREISDEEALKRVGESMAMRARVTAAERLIGTIEALEERTGSLEQHLLEGRHQQLEEVAQGIFAQPLTMRREVLDLLGAEAAAAIYGRLLREKLSDEELASVQEALRDYHIGTQVDRAKAAVAEGTKLIEAADRALDGFGNIADLGAEGLEALQAANEQRRDLLEKAKRVLGVELGGLQMLGALNGALHDEDPRLDVALGDMAGKRAFQLAVALGLEEHEYEVQSDGPNKYLRLFGDAWRKLVEEPDEEQRELYEAALAIKRGEQDEAGWLPAGLMERPSEAYYSDEQIRAAYEWKATPEFAGLHGAELEAAVRRYAGEMLANDGVASVEGLRRDMLAAEFVATYLADDQVEEYTSLVAGLFPAKADEAQRAAVAEKLIAPIRAEQDEERVVLDSQSIDVATARDPMHRALQAVRHGKVAFTPISQMTPQDKGILRDYFWTHLTDEPRPSAVETRQRRQEQQQAAEEVLGTQFNIFGEAEEVTRGQTEAFQTRQAEEEAERRDNAWVHYVRAHGDVGKAYRALQDLIVGDLTAHFAHEYARETGRELRTAHQDIPHALRHVVGLMSPDALERVLDADNGALRQMYESLRKRGPGGRYAEGYESLRKRGPGGRYAEGSVKDLAQQILEKAKRMQLSLFLERSPGTRRLTAGQTAEAQMRRVWSLIAPNFDPDQPVSVIEDLSMSDPKHVHQQRAIRMLERVRRMGLHHSTGSGKSLMGIGAFTHLASQGKVNRGLFIVPPAVTAQFGGEMNRYVEPGRFRHFADPSASADERRAAYGNADIHMVAVSHQAWRDDVTWAVAQQRFDGDQEAAAKWLLEAPREEAIQACQDAIDAQGWRFDFNMVDEGHVTLNRKGKPDARMARVADATTARAEYLVHATATAVKNDASEVFDLLCKVRPDKWQNTPEQWEAFRRKYGLNTEASRQALQRLVAPYFYAHEADTGVSVLESDVDVPMSDWQRERYRNALQAYQQARRAPEGSPERRAAVAKLMPEGWDEGLSQQEQIAKLDDAGRALGFLRDRACERVLTHAPLEHNPRLQWIVDFAEKKRGADDDGGMVPGLVFTQSLRSVDLLVDALRARGFRVGKITGAQAGDETEIVRDGFNADAGRTIKDLREQAAKRRAMAKYDILVCSEAGSAGLNLERARWTVHYDLPWTAKTVAQRNGRNNRLSQNWGSVEIYTVGTRAPVERRRRSLVEEKNGLMSTFMEDTSNIDDSGVVRHLRAARAERLGNAMRRIAVGGGDPLQEAAT
ncbi:MAG: helicase-related protein [Armatimonadota bacterium]